jgi:hypothetical protein
MSTKEVTVKVMRALTEALKNGFQEGLALQTFGKSVSLPKRQH